MSDRGNIAPRCLRGIEQDLEEVWCPTIADRTIGFDKLQLLFYFAGAGWNHRAAKRARGRIENKSPGCEMIAERIEHNVAWTKAGGKQRTRAAPRVGAGGLWFKNGARRCEESSERPGSRGHEVPEWRRGLMQRREFGFAQHLQFRQRCAGFDRCKIDALEP